MSGNGGMETAHRCKRNPASFPPAASGPDPGEPWLARALVKLNELDQYDDAELVRRKKPPPCSLVSSPAWPRRQPDGREGRPIPMAWRWRARNLARCKSWSPARTWFSQPADVGARLCRVLRACSSGGRCRHGRDLRTTDRGSHPGQLLPRSELDLRVPPPLRITPAWRDRPSTVPADLAGVHQNRPCRGAVVAGLCPGQPAQRRAYLAVKWIPQGWRWWIRRRGSTPCSPPCAPACCPPGDLVLRLRRRGCRSRDCSG